jgi:hypothetical protein
MADLNALIAQGVQFQRPPDPFAQYAQMQQMQQGQTANELARYQLSSAQRADELATNRLGNLRAAGSDPAKVANAFLQSGDIKGYSEFMKSRGEQEKMQTEAVDAKLKQSKQFLDTIDPTDPNAPTLYMQWHKANHSDPVLGPALAARGITPEQSMDRIKKALEAGPAAFATLLNQSKLGTEKFIELNKPTTQVIDRSGQRDVIQTSGLGGAPTTVGTYVDVPLPADVEAQKARIALAGRPPAQPRPEQPPVAVVDQATGKIVYVSREEALANRMTPATSIEGIAPKEIQKREAAYPQVTAAFKGAIAENEQLASDLEKLKVHPGLSGMTGTIYGRTLSMKGSSKEAKALYDKIVARGGFQKLTDMRQSSPTGAALGPVSDSEGKYLRAAFGALDPNQDTDSFQKAIDQAITELRSSNGRLQDAYGMTYDYRGEQSAPAPKPGGSALSPAEQSELDALRIRFKK